MHITLIATRFSVEFAFDLTKLLLIRLNWELTMSPICLSCVKDVLCWSAGAMR